MEQKINVAEIIRTCPSGMELDCTMYEDVYFDYVDELCMIHCYIQCETHKTTVIFNTDGTPNNHIKSKCVIFPKGKTTWEGFVPPWKFKDGDICYMRTKNLFEYIFIFKNNENSPYINRYVNLDEKGHLYTKDFGRICQITDVEELRFATEEEKQKLFDTIKESGYRWDTETKTLEKLCPFNPGDILVSESGNIVLFSHIDNKQVIYYHCILSTWNGFRIAEKTDCGVGAIPDCKLATEEQRNELFDILQKSGYKYNSQTNKLEKLVEEPKFKVGDRIVKRNSVRFHGRNSWIVVSINSKFYEIKLSEGIGSTGVIPISEQDDWELIPDKFDISNLKPFKSEVLVRGDEHCFWKPATFGFFNGDCFYVLGGNMYKQCIPYEGNEHLMGKTGECDNFYKNW